MSSSMESTHSAIAVNHLSFHYPSIDGTPLPGLEPVLDDVSLSLEAGSRCLLIGPNGAGKTTVLKILGGKHMVSASSVQILGRSPFHEVNLTTSGDLSYLGGEWVRDIAFAGTSIPLQGDFPARTIIESVRGVSMSRKERIMKVLDVNPDWRMHLVSDGQRRRVQLCVGLLQPFKVLLLDEITVDLDVLGRAEMLKFLKEECEERGATIVYATHIFDGLESWPTHVAFLAEGKLKVFSKVDLFPQIQQGHLLSLVISWLKEEKKLRKQKKSLEGKMTNDEMQLTSWNNGWAAGRLTSTLKDNANSVVPLTVSDAAAEHEDLVSEGDWMLDSTPKMDTFSQTASAFLDLDDDSDAEHLAPKAPRGPPVPSSSVRYPPSEIRSLTRFDATKKRLRSKREPPNEVGELWTALKQKSMTPHDAEIVKLQLLARSLRHRGKRQCMGSVPNLKLPPKKHKRRHSSESEDITSTPVSSITSADYDQDEMDCLFGCRHCRFQWSGCEDCRKEEPMIRRPKIRWNPDDLHFQSVPAAPVYYPTEEEFQDPFLYISQIRPEAQEFGICMIVPPENWTSLFDPQVDCEECLFYPKRQLVSHLCYRNADANASSNNQRRKSLNQKTNSSASSDDEFGFIASEMSFNVHAFKAFAEWSYSMHFDSFNSTSEPTSIRETEGEFWRLVEAGNKEDFETFYGSDLDSRRFRKAIGINPKGHLDWEVSRWSRSPHSLLKQIPGDDLITGVMVPWIYFGSGLSAFCWHVEDHALYSVNYLHAGAPKIWYGVPRSAAHDFELAMKDALPHLFDTDPQLLHRLVTHLSPRELQKRGIPVYRIEHNPGTFVVTFPNSYHGGFNTGWNCAEAVNFAPADWLPHGTDVLKKYRAQKKPTTFSHDALLINLVSSVQSSSSMTNGDQTHEVDPLTMKYAVGELSLRIREEERRRKVAFQAGISESKYMEGSPGSRDENGVIMNTEDMDCEVCKCDLFLSAVVSPERPDAAVCPEHASCLPGPRIMIYKYEISELQKMVDEAMRIFPDCEEYIIQAFHRVNTQQRSCFIQQGPLYDYQTL